tara:strand:- start:13 stop:444 length:432 start_codon:yes stop_codon:yes gene_type:complete
MKKNKQLEQLKQESLIKSKKYGINYSVYALNGRTDTCFKNIGPTAERRESEMFAWFEIWSTLPEGESMFERKTAIFLNEEDHEYFKPYMCFDPHISWEYIEPILEVTRIKHPEALAEEVDIIKPRYEHEIEKAWQIRELEEEK